MLFKTTNFASSKIVEWRRWAFAGCATLSLFANSTESMSAEEQRDVSATAARQNRRGQQNRVVATTAVKSPTRLEPSTAQSSTFLELSRVTSVPFLNQVQEKLDPVSGQLTMSVTDLSVDSGAVTLDVTRVLHSEGIHRGVLGSRWRLNWEQRVLISGPLAVTDSAEAPLLMSFDRARKEYRSDSGERLISAGKQFHLLHLDGSVDIFSNTGRLLERRDRNQNRFIVTYSSDGNLARVDGPFATFVQFTYAAQGRRIHVESSGGAYADYVRGEDKGPTEIVTAGSLLRYSYGRDNRLVRVEHPQTGATELQYDDRGRVLHRQWADGTFERLEFDDAHHLQRFTDAKGRKTLMQWSSDRRMLRVVDSRNQQSTFEFDARGRTIKTVGPTKESLEFEYDSESRLIGMKSSVNGKTRFEYVPDGSALTAVIDPSGNKTTFERDPHRNVLHQQRDESSCGGPSMIYSPEGLLLQSVTCSGTEYTYNYDSRGRISSIRNAAGQTTRFEFDRQGRLEQTVDPLGGATVRAYDDAGRLTSITDPAGGTRRFEYNVDGTLVRKISEVGTVTEIEHDARGRISRLVESGTRERRYRYDSDGRMNTAANGSGSAFHFEYDEAGHVTRETNPKGGVTEHTYDALGRRIKSVFPQGATRRYEYTKDGHLAQQIDERGAVTRYRYDARGRRTEIIDSANRTTRCRFNDRDQLAEIIPEKGLANRLTYDDRGNLSEVYQGKQRLVKYEYDNLDRCVRELHQTGLELTFKYDALGRPVSRRDNTGSEETREYDAAGRVLAVRQSGKGVTAHRYDLAGRLLEITDPLGNVQRRTLTPTGDLASVSDIRGKATYTYDRDGYVSKIRNPSGGETSFAYDASGAPVKSVDPLGKEITRTYDKAGRLLSSTDAKGQTTRYDYSAAGDLIQKVLADGTVIRYEYDVRGQLLSIDDGQFPVRYQRNAAGQITRIDYPLIHRTLQYQYDDSGRLVRSVDSEGNRFDYSYDATERLAAIKPASQSAIKFEFDAKSRPAAIYYPNGVSGKWKYDSNSNPVQTTYRSAANTIAEWNSRYDKAGNLIETTSADERSRKYQYDVAGQLTQEQRGEQSSSFSYAAGGNRRSWKAGQKSVDYQYDKADRLLEASGESFVYDDNGNMIERRSAKGTTQYTYDVQDRLIRVTLPDSIEISYGYSPTGERIWRRSPQGMTYFVTDGVNLIAELDEHLKPTATYLHAQAIDTPLLQRRNGRTYYYHQDSVGSICRMTDDKGAVVATYDYDAFGNVSARSSVGNSLQFTAREFDAETGLYYFRARYYDPVLGRFLTKDPVAPQLTQIETHNPYLYVANSPLRFSDPLGAAAYYRMDNWDKCVPWPDGSPPYPEGFNSMTEYKIHTLKADIKHLKHLLAWEDPPIPDDPWRNESANAKYRQILQKDLAEAQAKLAEVIRTEGGESGASGGGYGGPEGPPGSPRGGTQTDIPKPPGSTEEIIRPKPGGGPGGMSKMLRLGGAAIGVIFTGLDAATCMRQGHSFAYCFGQGLLYGGAGIGAGIVAAEFGTIGIVGTAVLAGVGGYGSVTRFINAPPDKKDLQGGVDKFNREIDTLAQSLPTNNSSANPAGQAADHAGSATTALQGLQPAITNAGQQCADASASKAHIEDLVKGVKKKQAQLEQTEDPDEAQRLQSEIMADQAEAQAGNDKLKSLIDAAGTLRKNALAIADDAQRAADEAEQAQKELEAELTKYEHDLGAWQAKAAHLDQWISGVRNLLPNVDSVNEAFGSLLTRVKALQNVQDYSKQLRASAQDAVDRARNSAAAAKKIVAGMPPLCEDLTPVAIPPSTSGGHSPKSPQNHGPNQDPGSGTEISNGPHGGEPETGNSGSEGSDRGTSSTIPDDTEEPESDPSHPMPPHSETLPAGETGEGTTEYPPEEPTQPVEPPPGVVVQGPDDHPPVPNQPVPNSGIAVTGTLISNVPGSETNHSHPVGMNGASTGTGATESGQGTTSAEHGATPAEHSASPLDGSQTLYSDNQSQGAMPFGLEADEVTPEEVSPIQSGQFLPEPPTSLPTEFPNALVDPQPVPWILENPPGPAGDRPDPLKGILNPTDELHDAPNADVLDARDSRHNPFDASNPPFPPEESAAELASPPDESDLEHGNLISGQMHRILDPSVQEHPHVVQPHDHHGELLDPPEEAEALIPTPAGHSDVEFPSFSLEDFPHSNVHDAMMVPDQEDELMEPMSVDESYLDQMRQEQLFQNELWEQWYWEQSRQALLDQENQEQMNQQQMNEEHLNQDQEEEEGVAVGNGDQSDDE